MQFVDDFRASRARSLTVFGDSITVGEGASRPENAWARLVAAELDAANVNNAAISGTVLQASTMADGRPRPGNGYSRYREALLGQARADAVVIVYGYNDARNTAAPDTFGLAGFVRDYRAMLGGLLSGGYEPGHLCLGSPPFIPTTGFSRGSAGFTGQARAGFETFVQTVRDLAREFGTFYAPIYETMAVFPDGDLASPDITHPNDKGHRTIAQAVLAATRC